MISKPRTMLATFLIGFFAALLGGTPSQISGPTGPMTVVMAAIFGQYAALYPEAPATAAGLAFTVVMMGGCCRSSSGYYASDVTSVWFRHRLSPVL